MHGRTVAGLILCTLLSKDALETQDLAAVTSAHAAMCHSPQASTSPSPPISAQATMDRAAAFCATHSPQLTPLSLGTIVCLSFLKGRQRSVADKAKSCYVSVGPGPITRASLGASGLFFKDTVWDLLCASHTHSEQRFQGEEDTEKWSHFHLAKLEETLMQ